MLKKCFAAALLFLSAFVFSCGDSPVFSEDHLKNSLDGLRVVIDAGHGGYDNGTQGLDTKTPESEINLGIAQKLETTLENYGAAVVMTRADEYAVAPEKDEDMERRAEIIERAGADIMISIHQNMYAEDRSVRGPQVFFLEYGTEAERLAGIMQETLNEELSVEKPRAALKESYFILKSGAQPSILIECGFLSNSHDEELLLDDSYRQDIADAITAGIAVYLESGAQD